MQLALLMILNLSGTADAQTPVFGDSLIVQAANERKLGSYDKALQYDLGALSMAERQSDKRLEAKAYNGIATDYYRIGNLAKARLHYRKSLELYLTLADTLNVADQYYKIGMIDVDEGAMAEAQLNFGKSVAIFLEKNNYPGLADVYNGYASMFYVAQNFDSVAFYAEKSLTYYQLAGNNDAESFMLINLGALFNAQGNHLKALQFVRNGISVASSNGLINQLRQGYRNLSETYAMLGDWKNAYKNQLEYIRYKDSIFNQQKEQALMEVETRYQTAEKERKIQEQKVDLLSKEKKLDSFRNTRNVLLLILLVLAVAAILFVYRYRARKKINLLLDEKNKQLEDINSYKDKLFAIISHDLRSPVSSFSRITSSLSMAIDHLKPEEIKRYLVEIDRTASGLHLMLRGLLQWSLSQQGGMNLNLGKCDIAACINNALSDCRSAASEKQIEISLHVGSNVFVTADANLLLIVLRNLMSNALKFAPEGSVVSIAAKEQGSVVYIDVSDQGPGVPDNMKSVLFKQMATDAVETIAKGTGFGLFISSELMLKMNGEISLLESSEKGSVFRLSLPLYKDN
ncbi:MAG: hypothetical protein CVU11_11280 [Bacteroidetes bacterium HGW-Bacteroidetes-6]|jgi:signal transduction histidine kinase|nr:MAG: hypothetical protein CVU11_11280 [Bacteroidetes bacterium HGW-Bacteroidetes-6]